MEKVRVRRERIYQYIVQRVGEGYSPTVREICQDLAIPSTSTAHSDLCFLTDEGFIVMDQGRNRSIRLPGAGSIPVPLMGVVTAGEPILAVQNITEYLTITPRKATNAEDLFALEVFGDSMMLAGILDGDIVVVEKTPMASNGEIVVAMIDGEATVKRFYKEDGHFRLQPENDNFEPIIAPEVTILGKVVSLVRHY